ncbi:MAG: GNAT family N-acetyltransferase [Clostridiales bacterium]|nr:GNAT family N-acetyltransferase [Clostridiales bacterium]
MDYQLFSSIGEVTIKDEELVKQDIYNLWQECFGDSDMYTDFYFKWKIKENQVFLIYYGLELAAMLHLNPYILVARDSDLAANYIVGVATKENHRRKGLMSKLLFAALGQMNNEKMPFTYLMPAKESIYLPFDFRIVYEQTYWNNKLIQAKVREDEIRTGKRLVAASTSDIRVIALEEDDKEKIEDLVSFTNKFLASEYDVFVKRSPYYYKRLINEMKSSAGGLLLCYEDNDLIGYLAYMAEEAVYITEFIGLDQREEEVFLQVWYYLASVTDLGIYRRREGSQVPAIMTRIVNLEEFVRRLTSKESLNLILEVDDPIIKENTGRFLISINEFGGSIKTTSKEPDLVIDIGDLTDLFFNRLEEDKLDRLLSASDKSKISDIKSKLDQISFYDSLFINDVV